MIRRTISPANIPEQIVSEHSKSATATSISPHQKSPKFRKSEDLSEYQISGKKYALKVLKISFFLISIFCISTHCFHYFGKKHFLITKHGGNKADTNQVAVINNSNDITYLTWFGILQDAHFLPELWPSLHKLPELGLVICWIFLFPVGFLKNRKIYSSCHL